MVKETLYHLQIDEMLSLDILLKLKIKFHFLF